MVPAAGLPAPRRAVQFTGGFTLLEILLAVALIGLLAAVLVTTSWHLIGDRAQTPEDVFWQATREARKLALESGREVRLTYDEREKSLSATDGTAVKTLPLPPQRDLAVDFLPARQGKLTSVLIGGQLVDLNRLTGVSFYADGTCMPFRVQIRAGGPARVLAIDPWTCAPVLTGEDGSL